VRVLEQQLSIQNGRLALIRQDVKAEFDSELKMVKQELAAKEHCVQQLTDENRSLQHQLEESKKLSESRAKEIENWRKQLDGYAWAGCRWESAMMQRVHEMDDQVLYNPARFVAIGRPGATYTSARSCVVMVATDA
jgi:hypothetical protein